MKISGKHKFVFLCLPNSGSRAVSSWLREYNATGRYHHHNFIVPRGAREFFIFAVVRNPYSKAVSHWSFSKNKKHPVAANQSFEEYAKWTNDPEMKAKIGSDQDRLEKYLSRYKHVANEDLDLVKEYLMGHAKLQGRTMTSSQQLSYAHHIDKIIHLENLNEEIQELPFVDNSVNVPHAHRNKREYRSWEPYYTSEAEANIYEYFKEDFEAFGYPRMSQIPGE